jgi:hypothetical protein
MYKAFATADMLLKKLGERFLCDTHTHTPHRFIICHQSSFALQIESFDVDRGRSLCASRWAAPSRIAPDDVRRLRIRIGVFLKVPPIPNAERPARATRSLVG